MFTKAFEKTSKRPYVVSSCPFCGQYVFPGANPEVIGHEESVWCDNCEKTFVIEDASRPEK